MLTLALVLAGFLAGCGSGQKRGADPLVSPYPETRVWAVAPLRNESGTLHADGVRIAEHLARQLENAFHIDVLPVNRTLSAMEAMQIRDITTPADARKLLATLGCDALVIGTVTSYDPYDPPKLGMAIELYTSQHYDQTVAINPRNLTSAATPGDPPPPPQPGRVKQPVSTVSAFFDSADPEVRRKLQRYASDRRKDKDDPLAFIRPDDESWHVYRISMDLYSEFVAYVMSWRLLRAETNRLTPVPVTASTTQPEY
ncbi:MAG: hypothetical protein K8S99_17610 [Planctomycetes bacterium]|nr:hypothetical protein [Planctomycetota bacterium]